MQARDLRDSDIPVLARMAKKSGYPYPEPRDPLMEAVVVIADDNDEPLMALAARRLPELYLYYGNHDPVTRLAALRAAVPVMAEKLRAKGYTSAEAFLPPQIERTFGRRLERTFRAVRNWASFCIRF